LRYSRATLVISAIVVLSSFSQEDAGAGMPRSGRESGALGARVWPASPESASARDLSYVSLACSTLVFSTIDELWDRVTTVRSFVVWYPPWKGERDVARSLTALGDTLSYRGVEGVGRSVVTWYEPMRELRLVHEMVDGSWGGSIRFRLRQTAHGVGLEVEEIIPSNGLDIHRAKKQLCERTFLLKRLAEGE
jgi:hypothetical protein